MTSQIYRNNGLFCTAVKSWINTKNILKISKNLAQINNSRAEKQTRLSQLSSGYWPASSQHCNLLTRTC